jgi:hypothetical protein
MRLLARAIALLPALATTGCARSLGGVDHDLADAYVREAEALGAADFPRVAANPLAARPS